MKTDKRYVLNLVVQNVLRVINKSVRKLNDGREIDYATMERYGLTRVTLIPSGFNFIIKVPHDGATLEFIDHKTSNLIVKKVIPTNFASTLTSVNDIYRIVENFIAGIVTVQSTRMLSTPYGFDTLAATVTYYATVDLAENHNGMSEYIVTSKKANEQYRVLESGTEFILHEINYDHPIVTELERDPIDKSAVQILHDSAFEKTCKEQEEHFEKLMSNNK